MKHLTALCGLTAAAALVVAPLTAAHAAGEPSAETSIRLAADLDQVDTLNPFTAIFEDAKDVLEYEYDPLAGIDETGDYGGILADDFEVDGTTWTYHIRDNATWSDGEPVTSEDVVWTYDAVLGDKAMQAANGASLANVEKAVAVDEKTVEIITKAPTPLHPGILPIVPEHIWAGIDNPAEFANDSDVVASGPFVISEYKQGVSITMTANEHFWGGKPGVDKLHISGFKNKDAEVLALRNNEIDMLSGLSSAQFDSLKGVENVEQYQKTSQHFWNVTLNPGWKTTSGEGFGTHAKVLEDQAFRRAIGQVIDREQLVDRVLNGMGSQGPAMVPPGTPGGFFTELEEEALPQGIEPAKQSLEAAGYTTDADGNRLDKAGKPITLRLMYNGGDTANTATAEFLKSWFADIGIPLELKSTNWDEMSGNLIPKGDYDMYIDGWSISEDPDYMLSINICSTLPEEPATRGASQVGMCTPEFDKIFAEQHTETDPDRRKVLVTEAQKLIYEYGAIAMLYFDDALGAYRSDRLDNLVVVNGSPVNRFSIAQATITDTAGDGGAESGSGATGWLIGGGVLAVAAIGAGIIAMRRKQSADDRK